MLSMKIFYLHLILNKVQFSLLLFQSNYNLDLNIKLYLANFIVFPLNRVA